MFSAQYKGCTARETTRSEQFSASADCTILLLMLNEQLRRSVNYDLEYDKAMRQRQHLPFTQQPLDAPIWAKKLEEIHGYISSRYRQQLSDKLDKYLEELDMVWYDPHPVREKVAKKIVEQLNRWLASNDLLP